MRHRRVEESEFARWGFAVSDFKHSSVRIGVRMGPRGLLAQGLGFGDYCLFFKVSDAQVSVWGRVGLGFGV